MRRFIAATLTAALVVIGLSAVLIGTASAATPAPSAIGGACTFTPVGDVENQNGHLNWNDICVAANIDVNLGAPVTTTTTTYANCAEYNRHGIFDIPRGDSRYRDSLDRDNDGLACERNEGNNGFPGGNAGHNNNGPWNDRLDGRYFRLDRGPALDLCDSNASDYNVFLNRNGSYRDRIVRQLNAQRYGDLRRADCGAVVSNDGNCVTYVTARDSIRNYTNDYNRLRGNFGHLNNSDRDRLNRSYSLSRRYSNDWNTNLSKLRTVCNDTTPTVTIINEAPPAPVVVTQAAPAPVYSAPAPSGASGGSIPSGSVNTGGFSAAYMLAHNRAI